MYYLVHSTLIGAAFYLLSGWITSQRGEFKDHFKIAPQMKQHKVVSITYFIIALMMAGLPPFSGFFGKVFLLQATANSPYQLIIIITVLVVSLLSIIAFTRVGFVLFWRSTKPENDPSKDEFKTYQALPEIAPKRNDIAIYILLGTLMMYVVFANPIYNYVSNTAQQIQNNALYEAMFLKKDEHGEFISVQPFDAENLPETKYGGETVDPNAHLIPYVISKDTLDGEHISEFKKRQILEQDIQEDHPEIDELKPMEKP